MKKRKEENRNIFTITEARRSRPFDDCFNSFFRFSPSPSFFLFSTILLSLLRTTVRRTKRGRRFLSPFFPRDYEPFCESLSLSTRVNELGRKWAEFYPRFYGAGLNREEGGGPLHRVFHGINFPFTGVFCCALWCSIYSLSLAYLFVCLSVFFFSYTRDTCALGNHHKARIGRAPFERGINKTVSNGINGSGKGSTLEKVFSIECNWLYFARGSRWK